MTAPNHRSAPTGTEVVPTEWNHMSIERKAVRTIHIKKETEYTTLYRWYLQEHNEQGNPVGEKFIPWTWGIDFVSKNFVYNSSIFYNTAVGPPKGPWWADEHFFGSLSVSRVPIIKMFGNDEVVKQMSLSIICIPDTEDPSSNVVAIPSYNFEDYCYQKITRPDHFGIEIRIPRSNFNPIKSLILDKNIQTVKVSVGGLQGLYAPWSPGIEAEEVKVLTEDHMVVGMEAIADGFPELTLPTFTMGTNVVGRCAISFSYSANASDLVDK
jgi:hypothetical protein